MFTRAAYFYLFLSFLSACGQNPKGALQTVQNPNRTGDSKVVLGTEEADFLVRINALRAQYDLPALQVDPFLQIAARRHSQYMNQNDLLSHREPAPNESSSKRIQSAGGNFDVTGENIACGNESGAKTFEQWFNSIGHLRNMLSVNYRFIGIAREGSEADRALRSCPYFWTTVFGG